MNRLTFWGFLGSIVFHASLVFILWLLFIHNQGAYGFNAPIVHTHISMQMLKGMVIEESSPAPEPKQELSPKDHKKVQIADPTLKPKPKENDLTPKKEEKKKIATKKTPNQVKPRSKKMHNKPKGDKLVESDASINSQATSNGMARGNNPNLVGNGAQFDERAAYLSALRSAIERNKTYPKRARMMRKQGIVEIEFILTLAGELRNIRVRRSSGNPDLDKSALDAALQVKPIGLRPKGVDEFISVPIRFTLN